MSGDDTDRHAEAMRKFWSEPCVVDGVRLPPRAEYTGTMTSAEMHAELGMPSYMGLNDTPERAEVAPMSKKDILDVMNNRHPEQRKAARRLMDEEPPASTLWDELAVGVTKETLGEVEVAGRAVTLTGLCRGGDRITVEFLDPDARIGEGLPVTHIDKSVLRPKQCGTCRWWEATVEDGDFGRCPILSTSGNTGPGGLSPADALETKAAAMGHYGYGADMDTDADFYCAHWQETRE